MKMALFIDGEQEAITLCYRQETRILEILLSGVVTLGKIEGIRPHGAENTAFGKQLADRNLIMV